MTTMASRAACLIVALLLVVGPGCKKSTEATVDRPETPGAPIGPAGDSTFPGVPTAFRVATSQPQGESVRYVFDWGNGETDTTTQVYPSGRIASVDHAWDSLGTYLVKVLAFVAASPESASGWSAASAPLRVVVRDTTVIEPPATPGAPMGPDGDSTFSGALTSFRVATSQAQGESVRFVLDWGDGRTDTTAQAYPSGRVASLGHAWGSVGTYLVKAFAFVAKQPQLASAWSDPSAPLRVVLPETTIVEPKDVVDLVPLDSEIAGWTRSAAMRIAETATQLYELIDGEAQTYIDNGFVKCAFQNYGGDISGTPVTNELRIFDMGDTAHARDVYAALATGLEMPWTGNNPGVEARIDTTQLFSYKIEFRDDRFFVWNTIGDKSAAALDVAKLFTLNVSAAIRDTNR